ncbi:sensor histidine kinase [Janthinobacterium aquaticum]|uniref:sensor histidine kinase n=1 Tax=Janthinobacterium sp. FT58W TaxID=2654254 RepID=UPI001264B686|nr:histidine kinase [Janthinobacterium sp. FT58W]KAB8044421.1 hypothetical protein GCM43_04245 [Janthinobacterium sp. FT58W]
MWKRFKAWYDGLEAEQLLVLVQPEQAEHVKGRVRRHIARRLARLTPIEREQLHDFSVRYTGKRLYMAALKMLLVFSVIGVLVHLMLPTKFSWFSALMLSNCAGFGLAWGVVGVWFNYRKLVLNKFRTAALILLPCCVGALTGILLASFFNGGQLSIERMARIGGIALLVAGLFYMLPVGIVAFWRNRQHEALLQRLQQEAERERLARELSESQLRLLRAQIEPHFLFNTLGAVQQLAEQGAPKAAALTADLIAFLRASLAEMRSEQVALGSEFEMVGAYLRVMQARMGSRLRYRIELPPELSQVMVPSMILLTLAENAIKHGIEPSLRGGEVCVSASVVDAQLRLRVLDTGVGLAAPGQASTGGGLGLDNVRRRLQLAGSGSLLLRDGESEEGGVIADIVLPAPSPITSEKSAT